MINTYVITYGTSSYIDVKDDAALELVHRTQETFALNSNTARECYCNEPIKYVYIITNGRN